MSRFVTNAPKILEKRSSERLMIPRLKRDMIHLFALGQAVTTTEKGGTLVVPAIIAVP